ncbi:hypothetical protein FCV25MIE_16419 [Fagus crenata]
MDGRGYNGYSTNNGVAPHADEWIKASYAFDDVYGRDIIYAERSKKPIIMRTPSRNAESYVAKVETSGENARAHLVGKYRYSSPPKVEPMKDYGSRNSSPPEVEYVKDNGSRYGSPPEANLWKDYGSSDSSLPKIEPTKELKFMIELQIDFKYKLEPMKDYEWRNSSPPKVERVEDYGYQFEPMKDYGYKVEPVKDYRYKAEPMKDYGWQNRSSPKVELVKDYGHKVEPMKDYGYRQSSQPKVEQRKDYGYKVELVKEYGYKAESMKDYGYNVKDYGDKVEVVKDDKYKGQIYLLEPMEIKSEIKSTSQTIERKPVLPKTKGLQRPPVNRQVDINSFIPKNSLTTKINQGQTRIGT